MKADLEEMVIFDSGFVLEDSPFFGERIVPMLIELIGDDDLEIRAKASAVLGNLGRTSFIDGYKISLQEAIEPLKKAMKEKRNKEKKSSLFGHWQVSKEKRAME